MLTQSLHITVQLNTVVRILLLGFLGFLVSMLITPIYTTLAYKGQWWKKIRTHDMGGRAAPVFYKLHAKKHERHIPTMAGIIFTLAILIVTVSGNLSRSQTWLPLAALLGGGAIGLLDDVINVKGAGGQIAGLRAKVKALLLLIVALIGGWWFYSKLGVHTVHVPFMTLPLHIGWLVIPLFMLVVFSTGVAVNFSDGLDGLAGGLTTSAFGVYSIIAFLEGRYGVAAFCLTVVGALLSYTWFNIFPARFFMGDVGSFSLGASLGVVAMLTDTVFILPIIGIVFVAEVASVIINRLSRRFRGKKVFLSSPIHHHFEATGWPETKVTMRFWIIGQVAAVLGLIIFLLGRYL